MARILFAALLLLFTLPAAAQTPGDSIAFVTADWHTTDLGRGAACRYAQVEMFGSRQSISVVSYPARHFATQIVQLDGKGETTGRMGEAADATAAINGSYALNCEIIINDDLKKAIDAYYAQYGAK